MSGFVEDFHDSFEDARDAVLARTGGSRLRVLPEDRWDLDGNPVFACCGETVQPVAGRWRVLRWAEGAKR